MKTKFYSGLFFIVLFLNIFINAQTCPSNVSSTYTTTGQSCATFGSITVTSNPNIGVLYILYNASDTGFSSPLSSNTTGSFTSLAFGNYTVRVVCNDTPSVIYQTISNITVQNLNTTINATISATSCTNFAPGGTISATNVTGGTGQYEYKFVKSNDPAFPETTGTYQNGNTFTTVANTSAWGTYQIRIRDKNCPSNYRTFSFNLQPSINKVASIYLQGSNPMMSQPGCPANKIEFGPFYFYDSSGSSINAGSLGIKVRIFEASGSAGSCTATSTLLGQGTIIHASDRIITNQSSTGLYSIETTTPCGEISNICWTTDVNPSFTAGVIYSDCTDPGKFSIQSGYGIFLPHPLTVVVKNPSGNIIYSGSADVAWQTPFQTTTGNYTVTYSNTCGWSQTLIVPTTAPGTLPTSTAYFTQTDQYPSCTDGDSQHIEGSTTLRITINYDYGAVTDTRNFTLISGPDPSMIGKVIPLAYGYSTWVNMIPGNYVFRLSNQCGQTKDFSYTITPNYLTNVDYTISSQSACTQNAGSISWNITSFVGVAGDPGIKIVLLDANTDAEVNSLSYATSGTFYNVPNGSYKLRIAQNYNTNCGTNKYYYYPNNDSTIVINSAAPPQFSSIVGTICEDSSGNQIASGNAYLTLTGTGPYTISYGLQGANPSTYTTVTNAPANFSATGLQPNQNYTFNVTDACGSGSSINIHIGNLQSLMLENNKQPCYGQSYSLIMGDYAGATYVWKDPAGNILSNTRTYNFPSNYTAANDGAYTVEVTFGSCLKRIITVNLNGAKCGQPILENVCYKVPSGTGPSLDTLIGITAFGRAGANNSNWPMVRKGGFIALESSTKGFVITRTSDASITNPVIGMMIYCTTHNCIEIHTTTGWKCFTKPSCPD